MITYHFKLPSKHEITFGSLGSGYVFPYFSVFEKNRVAKTFFIENTVVIADIHLDNPTMVDLELLCSNELATETQSMVLRWVNHIFDLENDYSSVLERLQELSEEISIEVPTSIAVPFVHSPDEMLLSALLSQNTTERFFRKMCDCLAKNFGAKMQINQLTYYSFPTLGELLESGSSGLAECRIGYRHRVIPNLEAFMKKNPLDRLMQQNDVSLIKTLTEINGIGDYSARCFLIYHLKRFDVVFLDSWVRKVMHKLFDLPMQISIGKFTEFATKLFSPSPALILDYLLSHSE